jgi:hypothetical protein
MNFKKLISHLAASFFSSFPAFDLMLGACQADKCQQWRVTSLGFHRQACWPMMPTF